ncbi:MAG: hypothetical protein ACK4UP_08010 [Spirosomataceae bacterium]
MKRGIMQIGTLLMVANLLLGSIGFSYYEHLCHFSGKSEVRIDNPANCCEKPEKENKKAHDRQQIEASDCCSIDVKVVQIDAASLIKTGKAQEQVLLSVLPSFFVNIPLSISQDINLPVIQSNRWKLLPHKPKLFLVFASFLI